jgi:hypothetical protein
MDYYSHTSELLNHTGVNHAALPQAIYALTDHIVNRQSSMMAYNDISWVFGGTLSA